jgi:hypothetical protein
VEQSSGQTGLGVQRQPEHAANEARELTPVSPSAKDVDRVEKSALQKLEIARTTSLNANKAFLLYAISLAVFWVQGVAPVLGILREIGPELSKTEQALSRSKRLLEKDAASNLNAQRLAVRTAQDEIDRMLSKVPKVTKLVGGFELPVPPIYAPFVWCVLALALLVYLNYCRRRQATLMARGLRILKENVPYAPPYLSDLCPGLPWWLAPLPARNGPHGLTSEELNRAAGWISERRRIAVFSISAMGLLFAVQVATLIISLRTFSVLLRDPWARFPMVELTVLVFAATLVCALDWFSPHRVPDHMADETNPNRWERRHFLQTAGLAFASVGIFPTRNLLKSYFPPPLRKRSVNIKTPNPRFRKRQRAALPGEAVAAPNTAFVNRRSGVIHYAGAVNAPTQPCIRGVSSAALTSFSSMSLADALAEPSAQAPVRVRQRFPGAKGKNRLHASCASWAVESEAEALFAKGQNQDACKLILGVLQTRPYDVRLYDRVAAASVAFNLPDQRRDLVALAKKAVSLRRSFRVASPPTAGKAGLLQRIVGEYEELANVVPGRKRRRCKRGTVVARARHFGAGGHSRDLSDTLEQRIRKWEDHNSSWFKRWAGGKKWKPSSPARVCKA